MEKYNLSVSGEFKNGFPNLAIIKKAIRRLYKHLPVQKIRSFSRNISPAEVEINRTEDLTISVQRLAATLARHLQLPYALVIVNFRDMGNRAGQVELTPAAEYLVELHSRYRSDPRDIPAVLAHEVTHIFLHQHGIEFPSELENEILTDTASVYLGIGWLSLNAHRITVTEQDWQIDNNTHEIAATYERLGYLTPDELGYVLQKRAHAFGEAPWSLITSEAARAAFRRGAKLADRAYKSAPLASCSWWRRWGYLWNRRYVMKVNQASGLSGTSREFAAYRLEVVAAGRRVIFECPICTQQLRVPVEKRVVVRCSVCSASIKVST